MAGKTWKEIHLYKRRFWKAHIKVWKKSGLTQNEYCRRNKLKSNQLTYWKTKFNKETPEQVNFVPVPVNIDNVHNVIDSGDSGVSVQLGKIQIRIHNDFNPACLVKVVSALEKRQ